MSDGMRDHKHVSGRACECLSRPQYRVGYYCPRGGGHYDLMEGEDYDGSCGSKGWAVYLDAEPGDEDLPKGEWV